MRKPANRGAPPRLEILEDRVLLSVMTSTEPPQGSGASRQPAVTAGTTPSASGQNTTPNQVPEDSEGGEIYKPSSPEGGTVAPARSLAGPAAFAMPPLSSAALGNVSFLRTQKLPPNVLEAAYFLVRSKMDGAADSFPTGVLQAAARTAQALAHSDGETPADVVFLPGNLLPGLESQPVPSSPPQTDVSRLFNPPAPPGHFGLFDPDAVWLSASTTAPTEVARDRENASDFTQAWSALSHSLPEVAPAATAVLAGVLPVDWSALEHGAAQFFARLDHLGQDLSTSLLPKLTPWLAFMALAPVTLEVLRLRLLKRPVRPPE